MPQSRSSPVVVPPVRLADEGEHGLCALAVWAESPFFTARERAVLALTEALTKLSQDRTRRGLQRSRGALSQAELAELIWAIAVINTWNRLGATARPRPLAQTRTR
jgi:alkylhydroperoxidase family enzyme